MPIDIFAALGALVRAEASRTAPKTKPTAPTAHTAPAPATHTERDRAQNPGNPEPPPARPPGGSPPTASDAGTAAASPPERPRPTLLRRLSALTSITQKGRTGSTSGRRAADS
ncbi:hypothetical protein ACGFOU_19840 [Streptomyces sp. NPDC048595]|uniref:hypothetical protein n=1 Tax=Streptomyces sp. NPDC048595 TaxID=3365576 RepID=UPI003715A6D0